MRSFLKVTASFCIIMGCKVVSYQNWRCERNPAVQSSKDGTGSIAIQWDHPQSLTDCNFAALWPKDMDLYYLLRKDSNIPTNHTTSAVYESGSNFRIDFALSKWPHFISAYLIGALCLSLETVDKSFWCTSACLV